MNLIEHNFSKSSLLSNFPPMESCEFAGETPGGFQRFRCVREGKTFSLMVSWLIAKEESMIWKSCDELIARTLKEAAQLIRGFYGFEVISLQLGDSIRAFQWDALRSLIVNHARVLQPGESRLIQYTSLFGILKKRVPEDWGKIDYQCPVKVYSKPSGEIDLWIKKMIREGEALKEDFEIVLQDLSAEPLFRFGQEEQTLRLEKTLKAVLEKGPLPQIFITDRKHCTELGDQFGLRPYV